MKSVVLKYCLIVLFLSSLSAGGHETDHEYLYEEDSRQTVNNDKQHIIAKRSTSNIVNLGMFTHRSFPGQVYSIYVDSTMTRLMVEIKADRSSPVVSLLTTSGTPCPGPKRNGTASSGTVTAYFDVNINGDYGLWQLQKSDASTWNVNIQAESSLDFTYQFLEGSSMHSPIIGPPVQGETYNTLVTVAEYNKIKAVDLFLVFVPENFRPEKMPPLIKNGNGKYEVAKLKMLNKDFMIGIQGRDKSNKAFRRVTVIKPIAVLLNVPLFSNQTAKLYENSTLVIPFTVTNKLSQDQELDIRIRDTKGLVVQHLNASTTLKPSQNFTGQFTIKGNLPPGNETTVTITVTRVLGIGRTSPGPSAMHTFVIISNKTTTTSTSTSTSTTRTTTSMSTSQSVVTTSFLNSTSSVGSSHNSSTAASVTTVSNKQTNAKFTATIQRGQSNPITTTHYVSNALSSNGQATTSITTKHENKNRAFSSEELFGAASISGMSAGLLIGVAALVTMGLVFRKFINKKKVSPQNDENKNSVSELSWT